MAQNSSDDELLARLREFYQRHGRSPTIRDFPGGSTIEKRFGSWNAALQMAGLPINKQGRFSNEELLDKLRLFHQQHGRPPTLQEFPSGSTIEQRFGSWNSALEAAGLPVNKPDKIPDEILLDRLRAFYNEQSRSPTYAELLGATTILTRFGGWNKALQAAGLSLNVPKYHLTKGQVSRNTISDTARVLYAQYHGGSPSRCEVCGYEKFIEICHIRAVADFPAEATLEEINARDNLIALCPNCHRELDSGLLRLP